MDWTEFRENLAREFGESDLSKPVGMLNMLKFWDVARYPPGYDEKLMSGKAAYKRYIEDVDKRFGGNGLHLIFNGKQVLIGPAREWDNIFIVLYPSRGIFMEMIDHPSYQAVYHHRQAALMDSRLIALDGVD